MFFKLKRLQFAILNVFINYFRYHRILKKEKQKALAQVDLEKLSKDDPELFEKQLEKAEKMRAMVSRGVL